MRWSDQEWDDEEGKEASLRNRWGQLGPIARSRRGEAETERDAGKFWTSPSPGSRWLFETLTCPGFAKKGSGESQVQDD